jgi:PAS domain-containing protein
MLHYEATIINIIMRSSMSEGYQDNGAMFTSSSHRVIFINETLQKMLKYPDTALSTMIGKPAFEILGLAHETYQQIIEQIGIEGKVNEQPLELYTQSGDILSVLLHGEANTDVGGGFAGIDYMFHPTEEQVVSSETEVDEVVPDNMIQEVMRYYFKRQLEGLDELMILWGGEKFSLYLHHVVNNTAQQHGWAVAMENNKIIVDTEMTLVEAYHGLLYKAAAYVKEALGDGIVHKQVEHINDKTNPSTFDYIERDWLKRL